MYVCVHACAELLRKILFFNWHIVSNVSCNICTSRVKKHITLFFFNPTCSVRDCAVQKVTTQLFETVEALDKSGDADGANKVRLLSWLLSCFLFFLIFFSFFILFSPPFLWLFCCCNFAHHMCLFVVYSQCLLHVHNRMVHGGVVCVCVWAVVVILLLMFICFVCSWLCFCSSFPSWPKVRTDWPWALPPQPQSHSTQTLTLALIHPTPPPDTATDTALCVTYQESNSHFQLY